MIKSGLHVLFLILEMFTFSALNTTSAVGFLVVTLHCEVKSLSGVRLFATPWTVAYQASPSMGFSRQEYWSGLPFPSPGDLPGPGIEPGSPALEADTLTSEPPLNNLIFNLFIYSILTTTRGMWDLNSPTKDGIFAPCFGRQF